jgi:hypothetical protein
MGSSSKTLVRDWNGDGAPDLVTLSSVLVVYLNKGNGTFEDGMDLRHLHDPSW